MLTREQIDAYIKNVPASASADDRRTAYSVITGFGEDKSIGEIVQYYSLDRDGVNYWMQYFKFADMKAESTGKRSSKSKKIEQYLKQNIGKVVTPKQVSEDINMSLPTFYNFYNANRSYFKKIQRGQFEIIDPKAERAKA